MCTKSQLKIIFEQMINCYREVFGEDIMDIYLFGSYARGDYSDESDIDMIAIVKGDRLELQQKLKKIWDRSAEILLKAGKYKDSIEKLFKCL